MSGIPDRLEDWNLEAVLGLVLKGYTETDTFDFKEVIKAAHDPRRYRERLVKSACAFSDEGDRINFFAAIW